MNLPFDLVLVVVLVLDPMAWFRGRGRGRSDSWSQCIRENERRLSTNRRRPPPGFGVRQSSGALAMEAGQKRQRTGAVQDATARSSGSFDEIACNHFRVLEQLSLTADEMSTTCQR